MKRKITVSYGRTTPTSVPYESVRIDASTERELEEGENATIARNTEFERLKKFIDKKINETKF